MSGNDFSSAVFDDSDFRGGVDLRKQKLPGGEEYALALDGDAALQRATALVDSWGESRAGDVEAARSWIKIWQRGVDAGQPQLFIDWPKKRISAEAWRDLRNVLKESS